MADSAGALFDSLLSVMARLRGEGGCPWDREQTRESLKPYLIEEAYEALEAIDEGSPEHIMEELGDVLFQVVFHSQVASEQGEFTMAHLLARLHDKMVRRHPHVFGDGAVANAQEALSQWERIKRGEGGSEGGPRSALEGVPRNLPALLRAQRLPGPAGRLGFAWPRWAGAGARAGPGQPWRASRGISPRCSEPSGCRARPGASASTGRAGRRRGPRCARKWGNSIAPRPRATPSRCVRS